MGKTSKSTPTLTQNTTHYSFRSKHRPLPKVTLFYPVYSDVNSVFCVYDSTHPTPDLAREREKNYDELRTWGFGGEARVYDRP